MKKIYITLTCMCLASVAHGQTFTNFDTANIDGTLTAVGQSATVFYDGGIGQASVTVVAATKDNGVNPLAFESEGTAGRIGVIEQEAGSPVGTYVEYDVDFTIGGEIPSLIAITRPNFAWNDGAVMTVTLDNSFWDLSNQPSTNYTVTAAGNVLTVANNSGGSLGFEAFDIVSTGPVSGMTVTWADDGLSTALTFQTAESVLVPEPSSTALLGLGALGLLVRRKR